MNPQTAKYSKIYSGTQPFLVGANAPGTDSFNIEDYSDFFSQYITFVATSPLILLQVRVGSKNYFDKPVRIDLVAGTGALANFFPIAMIMRAKERIQLDYTDLSGAPNYVYIAFLGYEFISPGSYGPGK